MLPQREYNIIILHSLVTLGTNKYNTCWGIWGNLLISCITLDAPVFAGLTSQQR